MDFESFRRHAFAHVCEAKSSQRVPTEGRKLTLIVVGTIPWAGGPEEIKGGKEKAESGYCPLSASWASAMWEAALLSTPVPSPLQNEPPSLTSFLSAPRRVSY